VLVPSWESYTPDAGDVVIALDPGRAFGTGGHASTRLCLQALDRLEGPAAARFLDVGAGSGLLAIACALAWPAARGLCVDIDPDAVEVSRENAARNQVADRVEAGTTPIDEVQGRFEVVTANIQPEVLIPMAAALTARLAPGGRLILSGILIEAADAVEEAYRAVGLTLAARFDEDGWRALVWAREGG
jgi:ribosomal protein L11 methyltransferase